MPKITMAFEFATIEEARAFLNGAPPVGHLTSAHDGAREHVPQAKVEPAKPVEQPKLEVEPKVTQTTLEPVLPGAKTVNDCVDAFKRYVAKGQGRTAGKFMNEVLQPKYGTRNFNQVAPERLGELHADLEAA